MIGYKLALGCLPDSGLRQDRYRARAYGKEQWFLHNSDFRWERRNCHPPTPKGKSAGCYTILPIFLKLSPQKMVCNVCTNLPLYPLRGRCTEVIRSGGRDQSKKELEMKHIRCLVSSQPNSRARRDGSPLLFVLAMLLATFGLLTAITATAHWPIPDPDFNPGANGSIHSMAVQADGKILVGGSFTMLGGQSRSNLGRLNPDGTLDSAFNPTANQPVACWAVQPDGKILAGGLFTTLGGQPRGAIDRLYPDGTLDPTFNPGESSEVNSLAVQTDGKILVGGWFTTLGGQPRRNLGRLNPDGTLDITFNPQASGEVRSLAVQTDGKILVGGDIYMLGGHFLSNLGRLNPDGTLDSAFSSTIDNSVDAIALQADGKILIGGAFGGALRRLNPNGTPDATFDAGIPLSDWDPYWIYSLAVQTDGKILAGGDFFMAGRSQFARFNPDGSLDAGFNPGVNNFPLSLVVQADGKILVGGFFTHLGGQLRSGLGRLDNTSPATQYLAHDGSAITWLRGGSSPEVWRTTFESSADGVNWTLLGAGTRIPGGWQLAGISLSPEANVRARGYAAGSVVESYLGQSKLVVQPGSRIKEAGTTAEFQVVASGTEPLSYQWFKDAMPLADQENATGATSPTLTLSGVLQADEGAYQVVVSNLFGSVTSMEATLTVLDPAILVPPLDTNRAVGESVSLSVTAGGTPPLTYQWYQDGLPVPGATGPELTLNSLADTDADAYTVQVSNVHGTVTSSPASLTVVLVPVDGGFAPVNDFVLALALQADGKILVSGFNGLGRLNPDGTLDPTFNPGPSGEVYSLALQSDGKILAGGYFDRIGRFNPDGTLDLTFNPGVNGSVTSLAVQADGKILVGGYFTTLGGQSRTNLGRLHPDGTLDASFHPIGRFVPPLALQADGRILVGRWISTLDEQERTRIARLNPDGTLDPAFNPPEIAGRIWNEDSDDDGSMAVQADAKILVVGNFRMLGGQQRLGIGRLNPDGTLDATFNPDVYTYSGSLALQTDGKILGSFVNPGGPQPPSPIARLNPDGTLDPTFNPIINLGFDAVAAVQADGKILVVKELPGGLVRLDNSSPATQNLTHDGSTITWLRGGTSPEVWRTTFESSADGINWTGLGAGTRIPGGWQLDGVSLPGETSLRARGFVTGSHNASGWFVETRWSGPVPIRLRLVREGVTVLLNWTGGQGPYQVQQTADLSQPDSWQNAGPAAHTNSMSLPLGPDSLFLRVRGQ